MSKVNHPDHYNQTDFECIELVRHMSFNLGNAVKYLWRYEDKQDPIEDLQKAAWYISDEIEHMEDKFRAPDSKLKTQALKALESLKANPKNKLKAKAIEELYFAEHSLVHRTRSLNIAKKLIQEIIEAQNG